MMVVVQDDALFILLVNSCSVSPLPVLRHLTAAMDDLNMFGGGPQGVNVHHPYTSLALHVATPVELAVTPLPKCHLLGVVATAAAQQEEHSLCSVNKNINTHAILTTCLDM
ncbi:hypothetical protein E2C01_002267 [Portunus trituberculatus]|uniref:Uncharacterized protein n=1 Tax=Portunus trituberculatus TaxID=210409 RepID=A0A5B7CLI0_PORTR|nr:hypothetical protein [Portunus trituberculatus]